MFRGGDDQKKPLQVIIKKEVHGKRPFEKNHFHDSFINRPKYFFLSNTIYGFYHLNILILLNCKKSYDINIYLLYYPRRNHNQRIVTMNYFD